jgi:hypothetical protein
VWIERQKQKAEERTEAHKQNDKELVENDKAKARQRREAEQTKQSPAPRVQWVADGWLQPSTSGSH